MSLTTYKTWASGDVLTAADMNTYVRDNGRWHAGEFTGGKPSARFAKSTTQGSISSGDALQLDVLQGGGVGGLTVASGSQVVIPSDAAGAYLIGSALRLTGDFTGADAEVFESSIRVDGLQTIAAQMMPSDATTTVTLYSTMCTLWDLSPTDYFELVIQFSGTVSNVSINAANYYSPALWAIWLGVA